MLNKLLEDSPSILRNSNSTPANKISRTESNTDSAKEAEDFSKLLSLEATDVAINQDEGLTLTDGINPLENISESNLEKNTISTLDKDTSEDQSEIVPLVLSSFFLQDPSRVQTNSKQAELISIDGLVQTHSTDTTLSESTVLPPKDTKTTDLFCDNLYNDQLFHNIVDSSSSSTYTDKSYLSDLVKNETMTTTQNTATESSKEAETNLMSNLKNIESYLKQSGSNGTSSSMPSRLDPTGAMNIVHKVPLSTREYLNLDNSEPSSLLKTTPANNQYGNSYINPTMFMDQNLSDSSEFQDSTDFSSDNFYPNSYINKTGFQGIEGTNFSNLVTNEQSILNDVVNSLVTEASFLISGAKSSSSINLDKYGLGKLTISVEKNNGNTSLNIEASNEEVKNLLSQNISSLKDSLEQNQLRFDGGISVQSSSKTEWSMNYPSSQDGSGYQSENSGYSSGSSYHSSGFSENGTSSSFSENNFTDQGFSSSELDSFNQEIKTDSSYSRKKVNHEGKIQVLI